MSFANIAFIKRSMQVRKKLSSSFLITPVPRLFTAKIKWSDLKPPFTGPLQIHNFKYGK